MKKIVLRITTEDEKSKRRIMKLIAGIEGVESVALDTKANMVTVIGETDPVFLTSKLRKFGFTELLSVGPAKEVKVGSAEVEKQEDEKSHSEKTTTAGAPQIDKYRPYVYTVGMDAETSACVIS